MSWTENSGIDTTMVERIFRRAVNIRRALLMKADHAQEDAALAHGVTPRRARSIIRREAYRVTSEEYRQLVARHRADIDRRTAELHALAIKLDKEAESEWSEQFQLCLPFAGTHSPGSGRGG